MLFIPDWPVPKQVKSVITTRQGGVSRGAYSSFNLATHVGDTLADVHANRELLRCDLQKNFSLDSSHSFSSKRHISWLTQVHGVDIFDVDSPSELTSATNVNADGAMSSRRGNVCAVLTADCLPVLMCDKQGTQVAAIHAGWQGMAKGILSCAINRFRCAPADVLCYFGPAISVKHFEVGVDVVQAFKQSATQRTYKTPIQQAFFSSPDSPRDEPKWFGDLYALARSELEGKGVTEISGGNDCSYDDNERFFSYRRDQVTGRMASLIWLC